MARPLRPSPVRHPAGSGGEGEPGGQCPPRGPAGGGQWSRGPGGRLCRCLCPFQPASPSLPSTISLAASSRGDPASPRGAAFSLAAAWRVSPGGSVRSQWSPPHSEVVAFTEKRLLGEELLLIGLQNKQHLSDFQPLPHPRPRPLAWLRGLRGPWAAPTQTRATERAVLWAWGRRPGGILRCWDIRKLVPGLSHVAGRVGMRTRGETK